MHKWISDNICQDWGHHFQFYKCQSRTGLQSSHTSLWTWIQILSPSTHNNTLLLLLFHLFIFKAQQQSLRWDQAHYWCLPNVHHGHSNDHANQPLSPQFPSTHYPQHPFAHHYQFFPSHHHHQGSQIGGRARQVLRLKKGQKYMVFLLKYPRSSLQKRGSYPMTSMAHGSFRHPCYGVSSVILLLGRWAVHALLLMLILSHGDRSQQVDQQMSVVSLGITRWFLTSVSCGQTLSPMYTLLWTHLGHLEGIQWVYLYCIIYIHTDSCIGLEWKGW